MTHLLSRASLVALAAFALCNGGEALAQAPCNNCGQVQSIRAVEEKGKTSGLGLVAGGVLGGVLGHQIGSGTGRTVGRSPAPPVARTSATPSRRTKTPKPRGTSRS